MSNPNTKEQLVAIVERIFEEIDNDMNDEDTLKNELEKLRYEFENGSEKLYVSDLG